MGALTGKVLILTGAAGGQGRVAARLFADAVARLALTDRDESGRDVAEALGAHALFIRHDVSRREDWDMVVNVAVERFGGIDVLINNAGIADRDTVESLTPGRMRGYLEVNLLGALNGMQAVVPAMRARGGGSIVNICSISALRSTPGLAGYGISKWALRGLSHYAAADFARYNVRVNLVLPGAIDVEMIKDAQSGAGKEAFVRQVPLGRLGKSAEIAQAALFLASDAASYMTGAELVADGGFSA